MQYSVAGSSHRFLGVIALAGLLSIQAPVRAAGSPGTGTACNGASPKANVRAYYAAINHHRVADAQACLAPYFLAQSTGVLDPDWANIVYVHHLHLRSHRIPVAALPGNVPAQDAKPYAAAEVTAQFVVRYQRPVEAPNGPTTRFIYTIEQKRHSPWRIASIGSGP